MFDDRRLLCKWMILIIVIGIALRLVLGVMLKYNSDAYSWALIISNINSGNGLYDVAGYNYSPVWGYILAVFSEILGTVNLYSYGDMFTELIFTQDPPLQMFAHIPFVITPEFDFAYTLLLLVSDLLVAYMVYWMIMDRTGDMRKAKMGFVAYFLGINVIAVCTAGGMFDTFSALITIVCVCMLMKRQDLLAGMLFSIAVLLKLFPVLLVFLFAAYLHKKDPEVWKARMAKVSAGAVISFVIVLLPTLVTGHLEDSFSFILSRTGDVEGLGPMILKYSSMSIYVIIALLELLLAHMFYKRDTDDADGTFLWYVCSAVAIIFIYPGTPQYLILLMPFLIIAACIYKKALWRPTLFLMVASTIFQLSPLAMELTSLTMYTDLISFDSWLSFYHLFDGFIFGYSYFDAWGAVAGVLQYLGVIWVGYVIVEDKLPYDYSYLRKRFSKQRSRYVGYIIQQSGLYVKFVRKWLFFGDSINKLKPSLFLNFYYGMVHDADETLQGEGSASRWFGGRRDGRRAVCDREGRDGVQHHHQQVRLLYDNAHGQFVHDHPFDGLRQIRGTPRRRTAPPRREHGPHQGRYQPFQHNRRIQDVPPVRGTARIGTGRILRRHRVHHRSGMRVEGHQDDR